MTVPLPLLAFGFGNLAMLGWLAAAAAPLLIHLWSRHRFREAPWAAMQFLLAALRKNLRRLQIQHWLLLALRTLLIAVVVLAVAEPYGENFAAGGVHAPVHKVLVIDGSFSMAYRDGQMSRFERAKAFAAELVRNSQVGDSFSIILMANPAKTIVGPETVDQDDIVSQIESLKQAHTTADLAITLELVDAASAEAAKNARAPKRHEVWFFTDLQRAVWEKNNTQLAALADRAPVTVIDVGQPNAPNLAVTRIALSEPFVIVGQETGLVATLQQFGQQPRTACRVELLVDNLPVSQQTVDVPARSEASVRFSHRFNSPGEHAVEARAAHDQLAVDDSRWLVVPVREEIRVLCIAGREGAATYIADALNPNPQARTLISPTIVADGQLGELELDDFDCIFLCNVPQLASEEAERLTRYASAGGGVVLFLGDRVVPSSYNAFAPNGEDRLSAGPQPETMRSLLPARIGEPTSQQQFGIDPLDYAHPIVAPFRGRERAGLLTTPVSKYFRLDLSRSPREVQVAAATRSGDPFIVTAPLGRGRTAIVATDGSLSSIDTATNEPWTLWPTWPSFLPIVRELLAYVGGDRDQSWDQIVGTAIHGSVSPSADSHAPLQVVGPDGRTSLAAIHSMPDRVEWSFDGTDTSGMYSVRGLPDAASRQFAINIDVVESDLAKMDPALLPPKVIIEPNLQSAVNDDGASDVVANAAWSQTLLWSALAIMFCESLLAWWSGRGGA